MAIRNGRPGHDVRATYDSVEEARRAVVALEKKGVDATAIELAGDGAELAAMPITNDEQQGADLAMEEDIERRGGHGLVIGAVLGAAIGALAGWLLGGDNAAGAALGGAVGGALFGGGLGLLWGGFSGMAVDEAWADTYVVPSGAPVTVVVHADGDYESVVETLRHTNPASLKVA